MKEREIFPYKFRVRKGFGNTSVLQVLKSKPHAVNPIWEDVPYDNAPRALRSEIID